MQHLSPTEFPKDFFYHRTSAEIYRPYLESCGNISTYTLPNHIQYGWKKGLLWNRFYIIRHERTDIEPNIDELKQWWVRHGFVTWIPYSRTDIPPWWRELWLTDHFQETSVNHLTPDYRKAWNDRARRALKKWEKSWGYIRSVDAETFVEAFQSTRVKHWFKSDYIRNYKRIRAYAPEQVRQWLAYSPDGTPVAGLACLDYLGNHTVHFVAFTSREAYPIQAGTGLIDTWFQESLDRGIEYLTFDQLRNPHGPKDQRGYTEFKENFIEHRLSFPKAYFQIF